MTSLSLRSLRVFLATLATALLAGGGCTASKTTPPVTPVERANFCAEFTDALCDLVERCDCGAPAAARCRAEFTSDCMTGLFGPEVETSIAAGRMTYDALAAGRALANLRSEPPSCGHPFEALGFRVRDVLTFGGVLTGTVAPGGMCEVIGEPFPNECLLGFCMGGVCMPIAGRGQACGPTTTCLDLDAPLVDLEDPSIELRCSGTPGAAMGTCEGLLAGGAPCLNGDQCLTAACTSGSCALPFAAGAACDSDAQCTSRRCSFGGAGSGICVAGDLAVGAVCTFDEDCESNACPDGTCVDALCGEYVPSSPPPPVPPGPPPP